MNQPDRGLDSSADLKILTRLLTAGLVAAVIVGFVALVLSGNWVLLVVIVAPYAVIAAFQWAAAFRRARETSQPVSGDLPG